MEEANIQNVKVKIGEDFRIQAQEKGVTEWRFRKCSLCKVPIGFMFQGSTVLRDTNCNCVPYTTQPEEVSWDAVAGVYNLQTNPDTIQKMNEFWGFNE